MKVIYFLTIQKTNKNKLSEHMERPIHNCKNIVQNNHDIYYVRYKCILIYIHINFVKKKIYLYTIIVSLQFNKTT